MSESFNRNVDSLLGKLGDFATSKTVVGEPIHLDGVILLPLVDVAFGMATGAGGNKAADNSKNEEASAGGLGAKITPSAVIVIQNGNVQLVNVKNQESINKLIDLVPGILAKFKFGPFKDSDTSKEPDLSSIHFATKKDVISED